MTCKLLELRVLDHRWVAENPNHTVIISTRNKFHAIFLNWPVGLVGMIDVGSILLGLPEPLHSPSENTTLSRPFGVSEARSSTGVLVAARHRVVEYFVRRIISSDILRVSRPVNMDDRRRASSESFHLLPVGSRVEVELLVMSSADQVLAIWRELQVLNVLLA